MPHRIRPDQTKVVLYTDHDGSRLVARCDPANPSAWRREPMYGALKRFARATFGSGRMVMVAVDRHIWLISPNQDLDLGVNLRRHNGRHGE